ncbi:MAG: hypothetical protein NTW33_02800 [Methanoregula sp.]|nr:hypothetical protein [Methanoregula sp.]
MAPIAPRITKIPTGDAGVGVALGQGVIGFAVDFTVVFTVVAVVVGAVVMVVVSFASAMSMAIKLAWFPAVKVVMPDQS